MPDHLDTPRGTGRALRLLALVTTLGAACAPSSSTPASQTPLPLPAPSTTTQVTVTWPVRTREHVDLWLHGFAMLMDDTSRVPLFRPGYREEQRAARVRANVTTRLDAERDRLRARLAVNRSIALDGQFVALAFGSWETLRRAIDVFIQANGDPQRASDQQTAQAIALLAGVFSTPADRDWLRVFADALDDESTRYYHGYWTATQRDRTAALSAVETAWADLRQKLARFLTNTQQQGGELLLSFPLGGEGRTSGGGANRNVVAVGFPATAAAANEALYTAVHEFVGSTAGPIVSDNTSPADRRSGAADRMVSAAQVRGGYILLQKTAPALAPGYARYYLGLVRASAGGDAGAALAQAFPLPSTMADALAKQIDVVLGGI